MTVIDPPGGFGEKDKRPIKARCSAKGCEETRRVRYDRVTRLLLCAKHWLEVDPRHWGFSQRG